MTCAPVVWQGYMVLLTFSAREPLGLVEWRGGEMEGYKMERWRDIRWRWRDIRWRDGVWMDEGGC